MTDQMVDGVDGERTTSARPTLTAFSANGLANRLQVLTSARVIAAATNRQLRFLWPLTPACNAPFEQLFLPAPDVTTVDRGAVADIARHRGWFDPVADLLTARDEHVVIGAGTWLVRPDRFPSHASLLPEVIAAVESLRLPPHLAARVDRFVEDRFAPTVVGVHLRRTDFLTARPDVAENLEPALVAAKQMVASRPGAGVLLCTDDRSRQKGSPISRFEAAFGERLILTEPRSLDRNVPASIEDALVDLWLLRRADAVVGSVGSSFSRLASFGRDVEAVHVGGATREAAMIEAVARRLALYDWVLERGRRRFGHEVPFHLVVRWYRRDRWMKRNRRR